jgi:uncharacterized beta-barrel protein YwiB (DUF1934 family)
MENNAVIVLTGKQEIDGEENSYELTTVGNYTKKGDKYYISYEGSEITGYENSRTTLKVKEDYVSMIRFGKASAQMVFEKGSNYSGYYNTPYGQLVIDVATTDMKIDIDDEGGEFYLDYYISFNHDAPIKNGMHVKIRKVGIDGDGIRTDEKHA